MTGRHLSPDAKARIVRLVLEHQVDTRDVAGRFGIARSTVQKIVQPARCATTQVVRQGVSSVHTDCHKK